jgi:lipoate---protein ligase
MARMLFHRAQPATPEECLAWDEAFLEEVEEGGPEVVWFWEAPSPFVVVGCGQSVAREVRVDECTRAGVPILRRVSGGGAVVQGPGCLNYGVALRIESRAETSTITGTNAYMLRRLAGALARVDGRPCMVLGVTDLALGGGSLPLKVSGNAQRRRRRALLFHGTLLLNFPLEWIDAWLAHPSREPEYRAGRDHAGFVANLGLEQEVLMTAIREEWGAFTPFPNPPAARVDAAVHSRYMLESWNLRR